MNTPVLRAVVVEDDPRIRELLRTYLDAEGFDVTCHETGDGAWLALSEAALADDAPDIVLLDLMLPGMDGVDVCRRLRGISDVPIIMVSARDDEADRILGLEIGADDYVTKPFSPAVLVARVNAVLRRNRMAAQRADTVDDVLRIGTVTIDVAARLVRNGDDEVPLTAKEHDLLVFFVRNRGVALSREQILEGVWGSAEWIDPRTIDVNVKEIRRKLSDASPIQTVRGVGYRVSDR